MVELFRTNAVGQAHVVHAFLPLILLGKAKKVVLMTTGMADADFVRQYDVRMGVSYSVSKAALNLIIAKFSAEYREKGVLFLGISPGVVDTNKEDTEGSES
jgi:NAD(P)-dependent dehydrogenase (short-subunit alcohol dehydrogenase family)